MKSKKAINRHKICKILKERRLLLEIGVSDLSKKTGISESSIYEYERGDAVPLCDNFTKLCYALGLNIHDFC